MSEISVLVLIFGPALWDLSFCSSLGIDRVDLEKGDENAKQYELFLLLVRSVGMTEAALRCVR